MAKTYPPRLNGQVSQQEWFNGLQEDAQNYTGQWSNVKESTFAGGATGNGLTDDTAAIAAAFADAEANDRAVFLPPGTYLTDTINYRMQSIIGTHMEKCILKGKPGKDILLVDKTVGQFTHTQGTWKNFQLLLDDSIDVSGTAPFTGRKGYAGAPLGNACFALDRPAKASTPSPPIAVGWSFENVFLKALGVTNGGKNHCAGIYTQANIFTQCFFSSIEIDYFWYGWWDDWPNDLTPGVESMSRDHAQVDYVHFLRNRYQWQMQGWGGGGDITNVIMHAAGVEGAWNLIDCNYLTINGVEQEDASIYGFQTDAFCNHFTVDNMAVNNSSGAPVPDLNCNYSVFTNFTATTTIGGVFQLPALKIHGNRNHIELTDTSGTVSTAANKWDAIENHGGGNRAFFTQHTGTEDNRLHGIQSALPDTRVAYERDAVSGFLGITSPMFISGKDLLLAAHEIKPTAGNFDYIYDVNADFKMTLHILASSLANWQSEDPWVLGTRGFLVGNTVPPGKVRVYVRQRTTNAGTMNWTLQAPGGTTKGSITAAPTTTTYSVISFDADLTGVASGTLIRLVGGILTSADPREVFVDWILIRPWAKDWPVERLRGSADNGDASKTLVVSDLEKQRWNTVLTANRTVTLPTTNVPDGHTFRIIREATAGGAFNLTINPGTLKVLATASTWVDLYYDLATALWHVSAAGAL